MSQPKCSIRTRPTRPAQTILRITILGTLILGPIMGASLWSPMASAAAAPKSGGSCPSRSVGALSKDAKGLPLVCTKITRTKFQWKLPALGSYLRPIALGQVSVAGPSENRFRIRVTRVNFDGTAEVMAANGEAIAPPPDVRYVLVDVEAAFAGPAAEGLTGHYWYARSADGKAYASSQGCGGGYGTAFDVTTVVPVGGVVTGTHCFEVPATAVESLRLRFDGADLADTHFALR